MQYDDLDILNFLPGESREENQRRCETVFNINQAAHEQSMKVRDTETRNRIEAERTQALADLQMQSLTHYKEREETAKRLQAEAAELSMLSEQDFIDIDALLNDL